MEFDKDKEESAFKTPPSKQKLTSPDISPMSSESEFGDIPYYLTIEELSKLTWESSPLAKVEMIYHALKYKLAEEVDLFWEGQDKLVSLSQRNIDIDNLQGITIYIVWALQKPTIIVDCFLTSEFLSRTTRVSTRTLFLKVLQSSIDYLLDMEQEAPTQPANGFGALISPDASP